MKQRVITISRQYGSGGTEIAKKLSEKLDLPLYDKSIISKASEESGIAKEHFERADERRTSSFLFSLVSAHYGGATTPLEINNIITEDNLFLITAQTIKELAKQPCIILGRCADDILKDQDIIRIFVCADLPLRISRIAAAFDINEKSAATLIKKTDKRRANYYNSYSNGVWGEANNYDICINSGKIGIEGSVKIISSFITSYNEL